MGCMEVRNGSACPRCGWREDTPPASPLYLNPRTILDGRYLLGRVLGAGGFGITYLAWDLNLDIKLAIKEYFPSAFGARDADHSTVVPSTSQRKEIFDHGLTRFLEEGRALAKFQGHPCIASVLTFFRQNGTSYLVMKYEDGITLQQYLHERGGRVDYRQAIDLAMPIMDALRVVHEAGILHRDISPDNIFINHSGQVKLLDFGAAKHDMASRDKSTQITLKRGYSPEEQYRSNGRVGTWTDVYALGATIYHAVVGQVPPESLDRLEDDALQLPRQLGVQLPKHAEEALVRSLAVRAPQRFQTIREFQQAIAGEPAVTIPPKPRVAEPKKIKEEGHWKRWAILGVSALCLLALLLIAIIPPRVIRFTAEPAAITAGQAATLRWSVDRGSIAITPDIGRLDQNIGERRVTPLTTTTYTLTTQRFLWSVVRSVVVVVSALPVTFIAQPVVIEPGAQAELSWAVGGDPGTVTIDHGIGRVQNKGHRVVSPKTTTTYVLRAEKLGASPAEFRTTVIVKEPGQEQIVVPPSEPPSITSFTVDPSDVIPGQPATLSWSVSGQAQSVSIWGIGHVEPEGTQQVFPKATITYTLMASGPAGSDRRSVTVTVNQSPPASEESGVLHVDILDEKGQPMPGLVEIEGNDAKAPYHSVSPAHTGTREGKVPVGVYNITVTASGYKAFTKSITVTPGEKATVTANMIQTSK
jgi:serine/threonine protein kinase